MIKRKHIFLFEIIVMLICGLIMVYSSSMVWANFKFNDAFYFMKRQFIFSCIGLLSMFLFSKVNLNELKRFNKILLIIGFLLLILVLIPGIGTERNGSRSWFAIGSFLVQPSEFFKLILIFNVSEYLSNKKKIKRINDFIIPLILTCTGFLLILLQPDFGSGIVMVCSIIVILFCAQVPMRYFIILFSIGVFGLSLLIVSAPYRMARILSFLNPWQDPLGSGFQIIQSLYALGPAGLFGNGLGNSIQKQFYLPEPQTDFIFAIFGEEFGFVGCILLLILFILIIYNGFTVAKFSENNYTSYVCIGIISLYAIQVMINLGVVTGLFPVTGITLPLMSYGGSSLIVMLSCFGILLSNIKD